MSVTASYGRVTGYKGVLEADRGNLLIGGVRRHESTKFKKLSDAQDWVDAALSTNIKAGRMVRCARVVKVVSS